MNSLDGAKGEASIFEKFPGCCELIGKLKDFQVKVPTDPEIPPIAQPIRRVPYHLRDKLSTKLDEHVELDIIEKMSGPSSWVSPVVVLPKPSGDISFLCGYATSQRGSKTRAFPNTHH